MRSAFICNQNQARSQVLSAAFSELLAPQEFVSFGLIARENTPLPQIVESVFTDWGLNPVGRFARNVGLHQEEVLDMHSIIAMTTFIADEVLNLGFQGRIIDLEHEAALLGIEVMDPQLMPRRQCAFELAKYLKVAHSALSNLGYIQKSKRIQALIPNSESSIVATLNLAIAKKSKDSVIVYGDLVAPRNELVTQHVGAVTKYSVSGTVFDLHPPAIEMATEILVPAHSVMSPASAYLGPSWTGFLESIDSEEIVLVTPPLKNRSGMVAESYLAALSASEIQLVP